MIHEVMVLDHSGPDFAIVLYSAALKMWLLGQCWSAWSFRFTPAFCG
jgi:formate hydrogenlyase subunit 4